MFVSTEHHTVAILPEIDQVIWVSQVRDIDFACQFWQWASYRILMLHRDKRDRDTGHTTDARRPDTGGNDNYFGTETTPRGVDRLYIPIHNFNSCHSCIVVEGCPALLCYGC